MVSINVGMYSPYAMHDEKLHIHFSPAAHSSPKSPKVSPTYSQNTMSTNDCECI